MSEYATLAELEDIDGVTRYDVVKDAYDKPVRIGQVSSFDMIEWVESNADPATKKQAGLRLLVKSIVLDEQGTRIPKEEHAKYVAIFGRKSNLANGKVIARILTLNGMDTKAKTVVESLKNGSGEANTDASPTA